MSEEKNKTSVVNLIRANGAAILVNNGDDAGTRVVAKVDLEDVAELGPAGVLAWMLVCQMRDISKTLQNLEQHTAAAAERAVDPSEAIRAGLTQVTDIVPGFKDLLQKAGLGAS